LREAGKNPAGRANMAYLRDDPYFFWYFSTADWHVDPYGEEDYALFDSNDVEFGQGSDAEWRGS
jgi:hypothetical protein